METHPIGMWIKLESVRCQKVLVRRTFSKSPIRTLAPEKGRPSGRPFSGARDGTRKAGPSEARVKNMPGACFLGRGRVSSDLRRIPEECGWNLNWFDIPEVLVRAHFPKSSILLHTFDEEYRFNAFSFLSFLRKKSFPEKRDGCPAS